MKKINSSKIFSAVFVMIFVVCFFTFSDVFLNGAKNGLNICGNVIIPSLFPFLIISSLFVKSGLSDYENKITKFISEKIFGLPSATMSIILMSLVGGFPVGIRMINQLYTEEKISKKEAERLSLFCVNAGPAFVINAVGVVMLGNKKAGLIIFISLTLSSLLIGFVSRFFYEKETSENKKIKGTKNFSEALVESVSESVFALISICAWIIFISSILPLADKINSIFVRDFLKAVSEVTSGAIIFSGKYPSYIIAGIIGFSGLCVHCQLLPDLHKMRIRLSVFLLGRFLSAVLSAIICRILFYFFPCNLQTFTNFANITSGGLSVSIPTVCSLFFMCGLLILDLSLDRSKKIC